MVRYLKRFASSPYGSCSQSERFHNRFHISWLDRSCNMRDHMNLMPCGMGDLRIQDNLLGACILQALVQDRLVSCQWHIGSHWRQLHNRLPLSEPQSHCSTWRRMMHYLPGRRPRNHIHQNNPLRQCSLLTFPQGKLAG